LRNDSAATFYPKGELVYYCGEGKFTLSQLRLSYKFTICSTEPFDRELVYVDAQTGKILGTQNLINTTDVAATAQTAYSWSQTIQTSLTGTNYRLQETGRGLGIKTLNMSNKTALGQAVDFTNNSTSWTSFNPAIDQYATDAHWGLEKTYDFYQTKYARNSVDNAGLALYGYVHVNLKGLYGYSSNNNAFWDKTLKVMQFGDGDTGYSPFVAMDIVQMKL
jgi:Zn-dependent metalloprotease